MSMNDMMREPVIVNITIEGPFGGFKVTRIQEFDRQGKPTGTLSEVYRLAHADAQSFVRRQAARRSPR